MTIHKQQFKVEMQNQLLRKIRLRPDCNGLSFSNTLYDPIVNVELTCCCIAKETIQETSNSTLDGLDRKWSLKQIGVL
jgi:hypothetical protein